MQFELAISNDDASDCAEAFWAVKTKAKKSTLNNRVQISKLLLV